jgi:hypothetical protein
MKKIDRYYVTLRKRKSGNGCRIEVNKTQYGKYVLFEDHAKRVAILQNQLSTQETLRKHIRGLEEENERLRSLCSSDGFQCF